MFRFGLTLAARAVAAGGSVLFFAWLALSTQPSFSAGVTVYISCVSLAGVLSAIGLNSVALRLIARVPPKWKLTVLRELLWIALAISCVGGVIGCLVIPHIAKQPFSGWTLAATFLLIAVSGFRIVANDALRALGVLLSVAWFEFGQVMSTAGVLILLWSKLGHPINFETIVFALAIPSLALFLIQIGLLVAAARSVQGEAKASRVSLIRLIWSYWASIGIFSFLIGLLGSASRDLYVVRYAALGQTATVAAVALALRIWEGLSIPLVAAHSDLSAHVVGKNAEKRQRALTDLAGRVRIIAGATWVAAAGAVIALCFPSILPIKFQGQVAQMLAVVIASRAISSLVGQPVALLSLHGAARKGLAVATTQMVVIFGLVQLLGQHLNGLLVVTIWCLSFLVRTAWEYWRLRSEYGVRVDVLVPVRAT